MLYEQGQSAVNCRDSLLSDILKCDERAKLGRVNNGKIKELDYAINKETKDLNALVRTIEYSTRIYKNINAYMTEKKDESLDLLKIAIENAANVVQDADVEGVNLSVKDDKAKILTKSGQKISAREGGAYITIVYLLVKYTMIKFQPNKMQVLFFDESFGPLDDISINELRPYLEALSQDILIVGIEQHSTLYEGLAKYSYLVKKSKKITSITKVE